MILTIVLYEHTNLL